MVNLRILLNCYPYLLKNLKIMTSSQILQQAFTLPCGVTIPNRIVKSAMSENDADKGGRPSDRIIQLYETWGKGGAGILVSGNVMVDSKALPRCL